MIGDFHFLRPLWLLPLLALPLVAMAWRRRADGGGWRGVVDAALLPHVIDPVAIRGSRSAWLVAALAWTIACLAMAGPAWEREPAPLHRGESARVIALALTQSLLATDAQPNRLARARYRIDDLLRQSGDAQTALIAYAGDAFVVAPLTDDANTVRNLVDALEPDVMPMHGNSTSRAIATAVNLIHQAGLREGDIVLIADSVSDDAAAVAGSARAQGMRVSVLGVGTATGAPVALPEGGFLKDGSGQIVLPKVEEHRLREVAVAGGGVYIASSADARELSRLPSMQPQAITDAGDAPRATGERWRDRGAWLLLALLPLAVLGFRRGWLAVLALAVALPVAQPAHALGWRDLWQRPDQQAAADLAAGDAKRAQEVAGTSDWRGAAAYRAGDYADAAGAFARGTGADAAYNEGNALARAGKLEDAIGAYDRALQRQPGHEDARANRDAVEQFLQQQQQQQDSSNDGDGRKQDQQQGGQQPSSSTDGERGDGKDQDQGGSSSDAQANKEQRQGDQESSRSDASPAESDAGAKAREQQQQVKDAVDREIENQQGEPSKDDKTDVAGVREADPGEQEKQQAMQQWLERVPDDPGGLLRRKFAIEHQRRLQQSGDQR